LPAEGLREAIAQGLSDVIVDDVRYIEPRIPTSADPYDPLKPEELQEDQLYAKAAILIEASSGTVIFEKNPDQVMYPASTTKILTVLLAILAGDMNQEVYMTETANNLPEGSADIPMKVGESIRFGDLLYATMVRSGNEGANLIAETISGNNIAFAELMNQAAQMYGCTNSNFVNPHGLHDDNHFTTPRDMAAIARIAMENSTFRTIAKTYTYSLPRSNLRSSRVLVSNSDWLLNPNKENNEFYYPHAIGIKTGTHSHAGYCYVGAAEKDGIELISVVFYSSRQGRWTDTKKLMEYGFSQFVSMTPMELYSQNPITLETSGFSPEDTNMGRLRLAIRPREGTRTVHIVATHAEMEAMARNLKQTVLIEYTRNFAAPIVEGEVVGALTYVPKDGTDLVTYDLVASRSIERRSNAPKSIEEIIAEVLADPNPFPPFSWELLVIALLPFGIAFGVFNLVKRRLKKTGRLKKRRIPKSERRYYQ